MVNIPPARERLRKWLGGRRGAQTELARQIGMFDSTMSDVLKGHRRPTLDQAAAIEEVTGIPARAWSRAELHSEVA